jgi:hypothetical protein
MVLPHGALVVDARIRIQGLPPAQPVSARGAA